MNLIEKLKICPFCFKETENNKCFFINLKDFKYHDYSFEIENNLFNKLDLEFKYNSSTYIIQISHKNDDTFFGIWDTTLSHLGIYKKLIYSESYLKLEFPLKEYILSILEKYLKLSSFI